MQYIRTLVCACVYSTTHPVECFGHKMSLLRTYCTYCTYCIYCIHCIYCLFCIYGIYCIHCIYCLFCIYCIYCIYCMCHAYVQMYSCGMYSPTVCVVLLYCSTVRKDFLIVNTCVIDIYNDGTPTRCEGTPQPILRCSGVGLILSSC